MVGGALGVDARNYIARNYDAGIRINGAKQSVIMGNYITDNQGPGVLADGRGGDAVVGYDAESDGAIEDVNCRDTRCNRIENNQGAGVRVSVASQITVRGNRMRGNTGLDVDLAGQGATANDVQTLTTGRTRRSASCRSRPAATSRRASAAARPLRRRRAR